MSNLTAATNKVAADRTLLDLLIDGGSTWQLEAEILFANTAQEYYDLYLDLMNESPYLSEGVILDLVNDLNFPDLMLRNLLVANPDAAKNPEVIDLITNYRQMSQWMLNDIEAGAQSYGAKEVLQGSISYQLELKHQAVNGLLMNYITDSTDENNNTPAITALLSAQEEPSYHYTLAAMQAEANNFTAANATLANVPVQCALSEFQNTVHNDYVTWFGLIEALNSEGRDYFSITPTELTTVKQMATNANGTSSLSRGLLALLGEDYQQDEVGLLPYSGSNKTSETKLAGSAQPKELEVYPNPASHYVNIVAPQFLTMSLQVFTIDGQLIFSKEEATNVSILPVDDLQNGVYLLKVKEKDSENVLTQKLIIQH